MRILQLGGLLLVLLSAAALCACKSGSARNPGDVLPSDGSAWNHNYVIIHPVQPSARAEKQVVYPPCPCPQPVQVPSTTIKPEPCSDPVENNPCPEPVAYDWPEPSDGGLVAGPLGNSCPDGMCGVPDMAFAPAFDEAKPAPTESNGGAWFVIAMLAAVVILAVVFRKAVIIVLLLACSPMMACASSPIDIDPWATEDQLAEVDDRATAAFEAQADTFNGYLAANPGDIEGATGAAFGASVEEHKKKPPAQPDFPWVEVIAAAFGVGSIGGAGLVRFLRGTPLKSGSGDGDGGGE